MNNLELGKLRLEDISVIKASIIGPEGELLNEDHDKVLEFGFGFEKLLSKDLEKVMVRFLIEIYSLDEGSQIANVKGDFTLQFVFHYEGLNNLVTKREDGPPHFILDNQLSATILNIVYSTARGIVFNRCLGTALGKVILPILDLKTLSDISENVIHDQVKEKRKKTEKTKREKKKKSKTN